MHECEIEHAGRRNRRQDNQPTEGEQIEKQESSEQSRRQLHRCSYLFRKGVEKPGRVAVFKAAIGIYSFYIQSRVREKERPTWMKSRPEQGVISDFHHRVR